MATNDNLEKRYIYEYEDTQNLTSLNDITDNKSYKYLCIASKDIPKYKSYYKYDKIKHFS